MKNPIVIISLCLAVILALNSCDDFLEKAPGVDVTEDTIFADVANMETFLFGTYAVCLHTGLPMWRNHGYGNQWNHVMQHGKTDEGKGNQGWYWTIFWNNASLNTQANFVGNYIDGRVDERWRGIRRVGIILERIDGVPGLSEAERNAIRGEARFLRAINYFEMLKRYGGVPIVDERLTFQGSVDDLKRPREPFADVVEFIVEDLDYGIEHLPVTYPTSALGRITKAAAAALKAKTLLHAASPLYNATAPIVDYEFPELLCYTNVDPQRWTRAANAAQQAITLAEQAGIQLLNTGNPEDDVYQVWARNDNVEIILAEKSMRAADSWGGSSPYVGLAPAFARGWGGTNVTFNFLRLYEKMDGTPQTWDMEGGDDLLEKYAELDPRFRATVAYQGSDWNAEFQNLNFDPAGGGGTNARPNDLTGMWVRKHVPREWSGNLETNAVRNFTLSRLADVYLMFAEAKNEADGPTGDAYEYVNRVRNRAGLPDLPAGLSQGEFRARVQNERAVELAFEDERFWDLKRWKKVQEEGYMFGDMWGLRVKRLSATQASYEPYVFETRSFPLHYTYFPYQNTEVFKGYLEQNPGW